MRGCVKALVLTMLGLALLFPLASTDPDGLQKVAMSLGIGEGEPLWEGLVPLFGFGGSYLARLLVGLMGVALSFALTWTVLSLAKGRDEGR